MNQSDLVSIAEAAKLLRRHPNTVRKLIRDGVLPAIKDEYSGGYAIRRADLLAYVVPPPPVDNQRSPVAYAPPRVQQPDIVIPREATRPADMPSLALFSLELAMAIKEQSHAMLTPLVELLREKDAKLEEKEEALRSQQEVMSKLQSDLSGKAEELTRLREELDKRQEDENRRAADRQKELSTLRVQLQQAHATLRIIQATQQTPRPRRRWWPFS